MIEKTADLRLPETASDAHRRLIEIARQQSDLAAEAAALIATMAGEPSGVADHDEEADHQHVDDAMPSPENLIALKSAAHIWRRSERSLKKLAQDHNALHRVGGRLMVDAERLRAGVFGHVFPLSS
jgi:hypothetical protein